MIKGVKGQNSVKNFYKRHLVLSHKANVIEIGLQMEKEYHFVAKRTI